MEMRLWIFMPARNGIEYSRKCLASLNTKHPYHLLLVDDHSDDGTAMFFSEVLTDHGINCTFIRNPPVDSVSGLWNLGIQTAFQDPECKYVLIINNDILFHPQCIDNLVQFAEEHPDFALPTAVHKQEEPPEKIFSQPIPDRWGIFRFISCGCMLYTRRALEKIGLFDENYKMFYVEDCDLRMRIAQVKEKAAGITTAMIYHYVAGTRKTADENFRRRSADAAERNREYFRKKWGFPLYGAESRYEQISNEYFDWLERTMLHADCNIDCYGFQYQSLEGLPSGWRDVDALKQWTLEHAVCTSVMRGFGLDIGCGPRKVADIGLDKNRNWKGLDIIARSEVMPFRDHIFDYAISLNTFEYVDNPEDTLREIHRVLKPGALTAILCAQKDRMFEGRSGGTYPARKREFQPSDLRSLIEKAGFQVLIYVPLIQNAERRMNWACCVIGRNPA